MTRGFRRAFVGVALLALLVAANPLAAAASDGATYGACVAHHAATEGGFSGDHNPGMHLGFAAWPGCPE